MPCCTDCHINSDCCVKAREMTNSQRLQKTQVCLGAFQVQVGDMILIQRDCPTSISPGSVCAVPVSRNYTRKTGYAQMAIWHLNDMMKRFCSHFSVHNPPGSGLRLHFNREDTNLVSFKAKTLPLCSTTAPFLTLKTPSAVVIDYEFASIHTGQIHHSNLSSFWSPELITCRGATKR